MSPACCRNDQQSPNLSGKVLHLEFGTSPRSELLRQPPITHGVYSFRTVHPVFLLPKPWPGDRIWPGSYILTQERRIMEETVQNGHGEHEVLIERARNGDS